MSIPSRPERLAILRTAKLLVGDGVVDCLVINASEAGFCVQLASPVPVPKQISVQFSGGAMFKATQRWARGLEMGFTIDGPAELGAIDRASAWSVYEAVRDRSLDTPIQRLRDLRCFDDPALTRLVDAAAASLAALEAALRLRGQER